MVNRAQHGQRGRGGRWPQPPSAASWACGSLVEQVLAVGHDRPDAVVVDVHEGPNVLMIHVGGMVKAGPPCVVATTKFA